MRSTIRELKLRHQTQLSLQDIARQLNPLLRGWIEYYWRYASSALYPLLRHINQMLVAWVMRKFKRALKPIKSGRASSYKGLPRNNGPSSYIGISA
jgi:RNA-directed DNA polymerase